MPILFTAIELDYLETSGTRVCSMFLVQVADMSVLALWYIDQGDYDNPVVVIIDDLERCYGSVLTDFILMLRYCSLL